MKRYLSLFLPVLLGLTLQTSLAQAKEARPGPEPGKFFHELNLTPQQQKQIAELKLAEKKLVAPAKAELSIKESELKILWMSDNPNRKEILAKQDEIAAIHKKLQEAKVDFRLGMLKILTPEQQKKVRETMYSRHLHKRFEGQEGFERGPGHFDHDTGEEM
jgi:Spy/CpxP family protein refolding chaperone